MDAIEPHWVSLLWFGCLATVASLAFLTVSGMFPLRSRPDAAKSNAGTLLVFGNAALLAALLTGTGLYGFAELRWSTLIIVTGLVVLFSPGLFQAWPARFRDGPVGLAALIGVQLVALAILAKVAAPSIATMS